MQNSSHLMSFRHWTNGYQTNITVIYTVSAILDFLKLKGLQFLVKLGTVFISLSESVNLLHLDRNA